MTALAILGPGAVGGFLAGVVARDGTDVVLIGREPTITQIDRKGIEIRGPRFGTVTSRVRAVRRLEEPVEILIVATKAPHLAEALTRVTVEPQVVVPLLNGIDHVAALREHFDCPVIAGTIRVQAYREAPNVIVQRVDLSEVTLAAPGHIGLEKMLRRAGVDIGGHSGEAHLLWNKLARLASLSLATAAASAPLGEVREDAYAAAREVVPVANALGAEIDLDRILGELEELPDHASSSLRGDVDAGSLDTELDAIAGPVLRGGEQHGLELSTVRRLVATIEARIAS